MLTNDALNVLRDFAGGASATAPGYINVGDDNTDPVADDSGLGNELSRSAISSTNFGDKEVEFSVTLGTGALNGESLEEVGLNDSATSGTQWVRDVYAAISKTSNIEVKYKVKLRFLRE